MYLGNKTTQCDIKGGGGGGRVLCFTLLPKPELGCYLLVLCSYPGWILQGNRCCFLFQRKELLLLKHSLYMNIQPCEIKRNKNKNLFENKQTFACFSPNSFCRRWIPDNRQMGQLLENKVDAYSRSSGPKENIFALKIYLQPAPNGLE